MGKKFERSVQERLSRRNLLSETTQGQSLLVPLSRALKRQGENERDCVEERPGSRVQNCPRKISLISRAHSLLSLSLSLHELRFHHLHLVVRVGFCSHSFALAFRGLIFTLLLNILSLDISSIKQTLKVSPTANLKAEKSTKKTSSVKISCDASETAKKSAALVAAAIVAASIPVDAAFARDVQPYAGLTPCKKNAAFKKNNKKEVKGLEKRMKKYDPESAPALALQATIDKTNQRFKNYGEAGLLCGADGLPHLIVDGNLEHLGEFAIPGSGFITAGGSATPGDRTS